MKKIYLFLVVIAVSLFGCTRKLMIDSRAGYQIVIPEQADTMEKYAAHQLQYYLFEMSKTNLPVVKESEYKGNSAIYIGRTNYAKTLYIDFDKLEEDGYAYKPRGENFVIAGGSKKGVLYGVYDLLEFLGFRKYTSDCMSIPKGNSITLPNSDKVFIPKVKYRTTSYRDVRNPGYSDWQKLSSQRDSWGLFVHTFFTLMPPNKYFKSHPEYYALRNGERLPTQLCLSNPAVVDTLINNLRKLIAARPNMKYWSVSQADNDKACQCDACLKLNEMYGGDKNRNSGAMIYFVNKVAKAFPDKMISTLAYWYTRTAPDNIKPEPNVNIMLCNIESQRDRPVFQTDPDFAYDLKNWGKLATDILIWDYNIQFANLVSPFPNLHTIGQNLKFFTDNNVNAFFMQANSQVGGEMAELRAYLITKLMWNPDADYETIIKDFVNGYYGDAGPYIRQYIDTMRYALLESGHHLGIFGSPEEARNTYLSSPMMKEYIRLFDEEEKAVSKDTVLLKRVQIARLPIMYAQIQISRTEIDAPRSMFKHDASGRVVANPEIKTLVYQFVDRAKEQGVARLRERSIPPDEYLASYNRIFNKLNEMDSAISFNKKIIPITYPSSKYKVAQALTDGIFGSYEDWSDVSFDNWVGYEGEHMGFILDLGKVMPVKSIDMDFLNVQAQADWNRLILPEYVTYATSVDGKIYSTDIKITNPNNPNPAENRDIVKIPFQSFSAKINNRQARYIKVHAESPLRMPSWHINAGSPAIIYSDEIVVK